ncbi:MAG: prephenate dehydrogenase [Candidatus Planktophila sp.]|nr:prephenate dehydrogenase [Candidatus Planktophila sp.]
MPSNTSNTRAFTSIKIIGSGLIGTSIGLALASKGVSVEMADVDPKAAKLANDLMASTPAANPEIVLYAGPGSGLKSAYESEFKINSDLKFIDIGSVKTKSLLEVSQSAAPTRQFLATHPMAGREIGGAQSARADLFQSRSWIYMPTDLEGTPVDPDLVAAGLWMIETLGASPVAMSAQKHDRAVALVSHLPQVMASLLAAQLLGAESELLDLAGAGLRDTTRIAASSPALWDEILNSNSAELLPLLINLQSDLGAFITRLGSSASVSDLIEAGNQGRSKIPGKHGGAAREYSLLPVVIEDKPGQLAALFDECAKAKVNVEDLTIEHSPGQFTGLITLALSAKDAQILQDHLTKSGWSVHAPR